VEVYGTTIDSNELFAHCRQVVQMGKISSWTSKSESWRVSLSDVVCDSRSMTSRTSSSGDVTSAAAAALGVVVTTSGTTLSANSHNTMQFRLFHLPQAV